MQSKLSHFFNIVLGLAVVFSIAGMLIRPDASLPFAILIVTVLAQTASTIVRSTIVRQMFVDLAVLTGFGATPDDTNKTDDSSKTE